MPEEAQQLLLIIRQCDAWPGLPSPPVPLPSGATRLAVRTCGMLFRPLSPSTVAVSGLMNIDMKMPLPLFLLNFFAQKLGDEMMRSRTRSEGKERSRSRSSSILSFTPLLIVLSCSFLPFSLSFLLDLHSHSALPSLSWLTLSSSNHGGEEGPL